MSRFVLFAVVLLLLCTPAWATQEHADPEGLYSHQLAHVFFMLAMVILGVQIWRTRPLSRGWKYIGIAAFLFLLWNIDTFTVHWLRETISPDNFNGDRRAPDVDITTLRAKLFYSGKVFDHTLLVGAIVAFLRGIRTFRREVEEER